MIGKKISNYTQLSKKIAASFFFLCSLTHPIAAHADLSIIKIGLENDEVENFFENIQSKTWELNFEQNQKDWEQQSKTYQYTVQNQKFTENNNSSINFNNLYQQYPNPNEPKAYAVYDFKHNKMLNSKNIHQVMPIASVTKLMTAYTFLKLNNNQDCQTQITNEDVDRIKGTKTRLPFHTSFSCHDMLKAMLVGSDNYAASSLARSAYGYNKDEFISEMNRQAKEWGMTNTRFVDSSGLSPKNVSTIHDLIILSKQALKNPAIRSISGFSYANAQSYYQNVSYRNTNKLIRNGNYSAALSKTGYIREAGYNLVFVNGKTCSNNNQIGVISLNNRSSENRAKFTMSKLIENGCY